MFKNQSVIYSPYGAYELKASYQRNLLLSNLAVCSMFVFAAILLIIIPDSKNPVIPIVPKGPTEIRPILPKPPSIKPETPRVNVRPPKSELPVVGPLVAVDDEEFLDEETELVYIDKFSEVSDSVGEPSIGESTELDFLVGVGEMPGLDQFIPDVQKPEFIYKAIPEYPRFDKLAGIEGTVWIAVEIDIDGSVTNARVYKTSGRKSLDQAALDVAFQNKFRPAIQNGHPVKLWTAYKVEFVLND